MQDKEKVKNGDAIKEIAGILAAGIIRMKKKGILGVTEKNKISASEGLTHKKGIDKQKKQVTKRNAKMQKNISAVHPVSTASNGGSRRDTKTVSGKIENLNKIKCQRKRDNLAKQEIFQDVAELDKRKKKGGNHGNQYTDKKEPHTGDSILCKSSCNNVECDGIVLENVPDEIKEASKFSNITINTAYNNSGNLIMGSSEPLSKDEDENKKINQPHHHNGKSFFKEQIAKMIRLLQKK